MKQLHGIKGVDDILSKLEDFDGTVKEEYYFKDVLGSVYFMTDDYGDITVRFLYSPFGLLLYDHPSHR